MSTREPNAPWDEGDDSVSERAAELLAARRFGTWSAEDQGRLDAWLAESALHRVAWLRVEGIAACAEELAAAHSFHLGPDTGRRVHDGGDGFRHRKWMIPLLAAASLAVLLAGGIPLVNYLTQPAEHGYSTEIGGQTLLKFADGTQVELNTDTAVRCRMTSTARIVWIDKGEAWFRVAHNPSDPFTVIVGKHRVTDLGTEFFIRRGSDRMEVAVLAGRASVSTEGTQTAATLKPGDEAIATPQSLSVARKTKEELADELAWRRGLLVFRNAKLSEVVREFNRYNTTKLVIADPSIADLKFSAELQTNDYLAFLNLVEMRLRVRADHDGGNILISRATGRTTGSARLNRGP